MIGKKYLTNIKILYVSFKKRRVINFNHTDNSQDKKAINEVTSSYKYYHKQLLLLQKALGSKKLNLLRNLSSSCLIVRGPIAGKVTTSPILLSIILGSGLT